MPRKKSPKKRGPNKSPPAIFKSKLLAKQKALLKEKLTAALTSVQTRSSSSNDCTPELVARLVQEMNSTNCLYCPATGCVKEIHKTNICNPQDVILANNLFCETAAQTSARIEAQTKARADQKVAKVAYVAAGKTALMNKAILDKKRLRIKKALVADADAWINEVSQIIYIINSLNSFCETI